MKFVLVFCIVLLSLNCKAQECEYSTAGLVATGAKVTKEYLISEKVFGGTSDFIFFYLSNTGDVPVLNFQYLSKSKDFPKAYCLDKSSRIYFQLANGKIVTLVGVNDEQCSNLMYDNSEKNNIRVLTGAFYFLEGSLNDLEKYPVLIMKVKYTTETVSYTIKREILSELNGKKYFPEKYFMNYLKCIK